MSLDGFNEETVVNATVAEFADSEYSGVGIVYIDRKQCTRCQLLVGELGKKEFTCTYENGNVNCPAARYQIVIGMDVEQVMSDFVESLQRSDMDSVIQLLADVKEKDPAVVQDFIKEMCDRLGVDFEAAGEEEAEDLEESDDSEFDEEEIDEEE